MAVACLLDWIDAPDADGLTAELDAGASSGAAATSVSFWTNAR